ncbi:MAG: c-type cytochrome [Pirellulales bacterium]|nr:c-type cytochrome [Pirellulales bacterium]
MYAPATKAPAYWIWRICGLACVLLPARLADGAPPVAADEQVEVVLAMSEPDLVTPTGIAVLADGSVLVVENHTHFRPPGYQGPPADRIRRGVDLDGDGRLEQVTTFFEGTTATMNLATYRDGSVFVATRRDVFRLYDDDRDGSADRRQEIARLETDGDYPHNGLSGFAFDDAGRVFFGLGENLGAAYSLIGTDGRKLGGGGEGGSIYVIEPDGTQLARVATGFWNPFHLAFDPQGELFAVDNDPDSRPPCRLLHVVPHGDYGYRFRNGRKGVHPFTAWNGELPGTLPMVAGTGEAPSGIVYCPSAAVSADMQGSLLVTSWGDHRVDRFRLEPQGASFRASFETVIRGDENFRPVGIALAPNGDLYLSDWVDRAYELHGKGRVWLVRRKATAPKAASAPGTSVSTDGIATAGATRREHLAAKAPIDELLAAAAESDPFVQQAARRGLLRLSRPDDWLEWLSAEHPQSQRLAAALLLRESFDAGDTTLARAAPRLLADLDRDVRFVGIEWTTDARLTDQRAALAALVDRSANDARQLEAALTAMRMLDRPAGQKLEETAGEDLVFQIVRDAARPAAVRSAALRLLRANYPGLQAGMLSDLIAQPEDELRRAAIQILALAPSPGQQELLRKTVRDARLPVAECNDAAAGLDPRDPASRRALFELLSQDEPRAVEAALRSLSGAELTDDERARLSSLVDSSTQAESVRQLAQLALQPPSAAEISTGDALSRLEGEGDPRVGRQIFFHPRGPGCYRCHRVGGWGGTAGPDLSRIGASHDRARLVQSIVEPAREIAPQYVTSTLELADGRVLQGVVEERPGAAELSVTDTTGRVTTVAYGEVVARSLGGPSIMPTGLVQRMTPQDFRHLFSWLESLK